MIVSCLYDAWYSILTYNSLTFVVVFAVAWPRELTHPVYLTPLLNPVRELGGMQVAVMGGADYHGEVPGAVLDVVGAEDDAGHQQEDDAGEDHDAHGQSLLMLLLTCVCLNTQ